MWWLAPAFAAGLVIAAILLPLLKGGNASINPLQSMANSSLQAALERAIGSDARNSGITVSAYYRNTFDKATVVFDLRDVSGSKSRIDVFRLLLDFAEEIEDEHYERVELAFRGRTKFTIDGGYFRQVGRERSTQNPGYTIRTFAENVRTQSGARAYPEWTGGMLGVLNRQMADFNDFHDKWYLDDLLSDL